jgi:hypothetical protein
LAFRVRCAGKEKPAPGGFAETRVIDAHRDVLAPLCRELDARVRLRYSIVKRRWWQPPDRVKVAVTGPAFALEPLAAIITELEEQAYTARQW